MGVFYIRHEKKISNSKIQNICIVAYFYSPTGSMNLLDLVALRSRKLDGDSWICRAGKSLHWGPGNRLGHVLGKKLIVFSASLEAGENQLIFYD